MAKKGERSNNVYDVGVRSNNAYDAVQEHQQASTDATYEEVLGSLGNDGANDATYEIVDHDGNNGEGDAEC